MQPLRSHEGIRPNSELPPLPIQSVPHGALGWNPSGVASRPSLQSGDTLIRLDL
jgi:hypothetical protein